MPIYRYKVRDRQGKAIIGTLEGVNQQAASQSLYRQGYILISLTEARDSSHFLGNFFKPKVRLEDRNTFTRQLYTLQRAGLPLVSSLSSLREQVSSVYFKKVLTQVIREIEAGATLSQAISRYPDVFDALYVNMVRSGEFSGKLDEILIHLAEMGEFDAQTRDKVKAATRYPLITVVTIVIAFMMIITFVIPKFSLLYSRFGSELPLATRILMWINNTIRHDWPKVIVALTALIFAFRTVINTPSGRFQWDLFKIKVPVFGKLFFYLTMSRFAKILSELLASGLPIIQSLQLVSDTIGNAVVKKAVLSIQQSVNEGKGMSEPMKRSGYFSPLVVQMVAIGEQSGKTDELLNHAADYYTDQANYITKNLTTLIEPMLLFVIGGMVLVLALGVFMPMWNLTSVVNK